MGNIRLSYKDISTTSTPNLEIQEENNYYPFGLKHKGYNGVVNGTDHKYGYNGVEEEDALGMNMLTMDLRQYDPAIARWTSIDPVTHYSLSPYMAFDGNPVFWADPSGADGECFTCFDSGGNGMLASPSGSFRQGNNYTSLASEFEEKEKKKREENSSYEGLKIGDLFFQRHPGKIDLSNKNLEEVQEQVIAWARYIYFNIEINYKNDEKLYLSDIIVNKFAKEKDLDDVLFDFAGGDSRGLNEVEIKDGKGNSLVLGMFPGIQNQVGNYDYYTQITGLIEGSKNLYRMQFKGHRRYTNGRPPTLFYMNLLEFITHLRNPSKVEEIVLKENRDIDIDYADIYLEESLSPYSTIYFFDAEQLDGKIEMELNGIKYINLFPLDYLQDLFEEFSTPGVSDLDIASKLLSFRINDA